MANTELKMKSYIKKIADQLFSELKQTEEMSLYLHSEESQFVRFNHSQVRQNTSVYQHEVTLKFQADSKQIESTHLLTLDFTTDIENLKQQVLFFRSTIPSIDIHPQFVPMENNGQSETIKKIERPDDVEFIKIICSQFKNADMAGMYCSGPLRKASLNSKGQFHFFESDYYFIDYSIYNGPKAAKGFYSSEKWNEEHFHQNVEQTKKKLSQLLLPAKTLTPGKYRAYLEPMAVQEILGTMSWGAFSMSAAKQGRSALKKLISKEIQFSKSFSLIENLELGFVPGFNSIGEIAPRQLPLVTAGQLSYLLTSTATATEYKVESNQANPEENLRSPEIAPGQLHKNDILKKLDAGLYLSNLHYINWSDLQSARLTGMTRFACFWVEKGEIQGPIKDLRFDDTVYNLLGANLVDFTQHQELFVDSATYQKRSLGAVKTPGALINDMNFVL